MMRDSPAVVVIRALAWVVIAWGFALAPVAVAQSTVSLSPPGPQDVMASLTTRLFAALGMESAATRHNADRILPLVDNLLAPHFDKEYAARLVLGLHWRMGRRSGVIRSIGGGNAVVELFSLPPGRFNTTYAA